MAMHHVVKRIGKIVAAAALTLGALGCAHGLGGAATVRAPADRLDQAVAQARTARVSDVRYAIEIDLMSEADRSDDVFGGRVTVDFVLSGDVTSPLTLDFGGGEVVAVAINDQPAPLDYNGAFLTLGADALRPGANSVAISYRHPYSIDGNGLHRFTDPEDGETYLYTYLWPYYANRLFPSFDQADLKARYQLTVRAPEDWVVVSAARETELVDQGQGVREWRFPQTASFSTYIFSLHAGPYVVWEEDADGIAIRLLARRSLAPHVNAAEWLDVTRNGLAYYQDYFDIPYPFDKYDQVLTPDFNIGAMENVAAVTFNERYIRRGDESEAFRRRRANTVLHEMAHMWFGDLVTMTWWNGLWLNESFATFMASLAVPEATPYGSGDHDFFLGNTLSAFAADGRVSTHPIEMPVPSTDDFYSVFDSITYGKGASVLRQLEHLVGPQDFRDGVSTYLKQHAYANTELDDFVAAIAEASGRDLDGWAREWLYEAGPNTLEAEFTCADGAVSAFAIHQTASADHPTLRTHRTVVALYGVGVDGRVAATSELDVEVTGARTDVAAALGLACPDLVFPNAHDYAYARTTLDPRTRTALNDHMSGVRDPLARSMFWNALRGGATTDAATIQAYLDLAFSTLPHETDARVRGQVIGNVQGVFARLERAAPASDALLAANRARVERVTWEGLADVGLDASARDRWFQAHAAVARSPAALDRLTAVLAGDVTIAGFAVDQDRRWRILRTLAQAGRPDAEIGRASCRERV